MRAFSLLAILRKAVVSMKIIPTFAPDLQYEQISIRGNLVPRILTIEI